MVSPRDLRDDMTTGRRPAAGRIATVGDTTFRCHADGSGLLLAPPRRGHAVRGSWESTVTPPRLARQSAHRSTAPVSSDQPLRGLDGRSTLTSPSWLSTRACSGNQHHADSPFSTYPTIRYLVITCATPCMRLVLPTGGGGYWTEAELRRENMDSRSLICVRTRVPTWPKQVWGTQQGLLQHWTAPRAVGAYGHMHA